MRSKLSISLLIAALASLALLLSCTNTGPGPATPPTFVMAWSGMDGHVHTLQSTDGANWVLPAVAPGPNTTEGAAVAHDGTLNWKVLWNSGGSISYLAGIGGLPSATATQGITWSSSATTLRTTTPVSLTPAVAFGNQSWVAVFAATGGLRVIRSIPDSSSSTVSVTDAAVGFNSGINASPALAFGAGKFVLAFIAANQPDLVAVTSTDATTWTGPNTIFSLTRAGNPEECTRPTSATLTFADGAFYAVSRVSTTLCAGGTQAGGSRITVFKSTDGIAWTTIVDQNSGPAVIREIAGSPGAAFAQCHLVLAHPAAQAGANIAVEIGQATPCPNPTTFAIGAPQTISGVPTARLDSVTAVAFGSGR